MYDEKEILTELASKVINEQVDKIFSGFTRFFKRKYDEHKVRTEKAFEEYVKSSIEKVKYTKTILYRHQPDLIEKFYVDLHIKSG